MVRRNHLFCSLQDPCRLRIITHLLGREHYMFLCINLPLSFVLGLSIKQCKCLNSSYLNNILHLNEVRILFYLQVQFFATHILLSSEHRLRNVAVVLSSPQSISSLEHVLGSPHGSHISSHRTMHSWKVSSDIDPTPKTIFVRIASAKTFLIIICNYPIILGQKNGSNSILKCFQI